MISPARRPPAFTIVEMLVVIAIIGVLVGLLMPALSGVRKRSAKMNELNNLKHIHHAWTMYGQNFNDAALPGFLEPEVQQPAAPGFRGWGVKYEYPDRSEIVLDPAVNVTGPWPWRLLKYLDYNHALIHGHLDEAEDSVFGLMNEAEEVAYEPAFGYNALYVGGWWEMHPIGGAQTPRPRFFNHCEPGTSRYISIPTTISQIKRSSEIVLVCSSSKLPMGGHMRFSPITPGSHYVTPPWVAGVQHWGHDPATLDHTGVDVLVPEAHCPIGRYTGAVAIVWADGHTDSQMPTALRDQRQWFDGATSVTFTHAQCP